MKQENNTVDNNITDIGKILNGVRNTYFSNEYIREKAKRSFVERWWAMCKYDMKYDPSKPQIIGKDDGDNLAGINDLLGISMPTFSDDNFLFMIGLGYFGEEIQQSLAKVLECIKGDNEECINFNLLIAEDKQDDILKFLCKISKENKKSFHRLYQEFVKTKTNDQGQLIKKRPGVLCRFEITLIHALRLFRVQKSGVYEELINILKNNNILRKDIDFNNSEALNVKNINIDSPQQYKSFYQLLGKQLVTREQHILKGFFACLFNSIYVDFDPRYQETELILKKSSYGLMGDILGLSPDIKDGLYITSKEKADGDYVDTLAGQTLFDLQTGSHDQKKIPVEWIILGKSAVSTASKTARDPLYAHAQAVEDMLRGSLILTDVSSVDQWQDQYRTILFHMMENIQKISGHSAPIKSIKWKDKGMMADCYGDDGRLDKAKVRERYQLYKGNQYQEDQFENLYNTCFASITTSKQGATASNYLDSKCIITFDLDNYISDSGDHVLQGMPQTMEFKILFNDRKQTNESGLAHHDRFRLKQDMMLHSRQEKYISEYDLVRDLARCMYQYSDMVKSIEAEMQMKNLNTTSRDVLKYLLQDLCKGLIRCKLDGVHQHGEDIYFYLDKKIYSHQKKVGQVMPHMLEDDGKITREHIDMMIGRVPNYTYYRQSKLDQNQGGLSQDDRKKLQYYIEGLLLVTINDISDGKQGSL